MPEAHKDNEKPLIYEGKEVIIPQNLNGLLVAMTHLRYSFFEWAHEERVKQSDGLEWLVNFSIVNQARETIWPFQSIRSGEENKGLKAIEILNMICDERKKIGESGIDMEICLKWIRIRQNH